MEKEIWQRALVDINPPGVPFSFRDSQGNKNIAHILRNREIGGGKRRKKGFQRYADESSEQFWAEEENASKHASQYFELPPTTKSTISIAVSPDGKTFASTHGDHTVKIICIATGRILQTLVGHPRTPWSVKFHPTNPRYVASGCLGFQVRFWDIETGRCLYVSTLRHAIISISFHASGDILAIASGTCVYTWDYQHSCPRIAMFSYQTLRSVTFLPDPNKILVGEANERYVRPQGQSSPNDLTVTLTLWDFDPTWALSAEPLLVKKAMHNSRIVLSHALIYNDGGFDISRCGRYLAICADFSLKQAEKEVEMEAMNDLEQILSTAPQDVVGEETSSTDDVNEMPNVPLQGLTSSSDPNNRRSRTSVSAYSSPAHAAQGIPSARPITPPPPAVVVPAAANQHDSHLQTQSQSRSGGSPGSSRISSSTASAIQRLLTTPGLSSAETIAAFRAAAAAAAENGMSADQYLDNQMRRVRARLQQSAAALHQRHQVQPPGGVVQPQHQQPVPFSFNSSGGPSAALGALLGVNGSNSNSNNGNINSAVVPVGAPVAGAVGSRTANLLSSAVMPHHRLTQIRPNIALSRTRFSRTQRAQRTRLASEIQSTWLALVSLDTNQLGKIIQTCHLPETTAGGVTSVKISPTSAYVLLGYGVRDRIQRETHFPVHRVTRIYRWQDMKLLSHVESEVDDVNIALFSPISGAGFLYGTKQGRLRVCSTFRGEPSDEFNCNVIGGNGRYHYDDLQEASGQQQQQQIETSNSGEVVEDEGEEEHQDVEMSV